MSRVAVLKGGRSLERQVSLRSGARVQDALERLGHEVVAIDAGPDLIRAPARGATRRWRSWRCTAATARTGRCRSCSRSSGSPTPGSGVLACVRAMDKVLAKHLMLEDGIPTPEFFAFNETAFRELGAGDALHAIEERLDFPIVVKPAGQGSALGIKFARTAADVPGALVAAFSYDDKVVLERHVAGRDLAVSILDGEAAADRGGGTAERRLLRLRVALRDRPHVVRLSRPTFPRARPSAPRNWRSGCYRLLGCYGFARVDLMLDGGGDLHVLEANPIPGLTETSLLPQAAEAAGIGFDELVGRILELALTRAAA